jgi:hypothetical protein
MTMVKRRAVLMLYCLKIGGICTVVTVWTRFGHRRKNQKKLVTAVGVKKGKWSALQESNLRLSASEADTLSN